jgi:hypothetical protein
MSSSLPAIQYGNEASARLSKRRTRRTADPASSSSSLADTTTRTRTTTNNRHLYSGYCSDDEDEPQTCRRLPERLRQSTSNDFRVSTGRSARFGRANIDNRDARSGFMHNVPERRGEDGYKMYYYATPKSQPIGCAVMYNVNKIQKIDGGRWSTAPRFDSGKRFCGNEELKNQFITRRKIPGFKQNRNNAHNSQRGGSNR